MDAKEFVKERNRMCKTIHCNKCPLVIYEEACNYLDSYKRIPEMIDAVEKWSKENPVKTNRDVIKETFGDVIFETPLPYHISTVMVNGMHLTDWLAQEYKKPEKK